MVFNTYTFKGQVHVFAGRVKIVSHSSCRTSAILKYICPLLVYAKKVSYMYFMCILTYQAIGWLEFRNNDVFLSLKIVSIC